MNGLELLQKYPAAGELIKQWFLEKMLDGLNTDSLPDDFKEFVKQMGIDDERVGTIIDANPRNLFDILDDNNIYVQITRQNGVWGWIITNNLLTEGDKGYTSRRQAEGLAVEKAIQLLNENLKKNDRFDSSTSAEEIPAAE